jgi:hypothetical protein
VSGTGLSGSASFTANQSGATTFTVTSNATSANTGSAIVARDSNGDFSGRYISSSYFNSSDDVSAGTLTYLMGKFGDNYYRSATAAKVATFISGQTMNISGSSTSCSGNAATATTATNQSGGTVSATTGSFSSTVDFTGGSSAVPAVRVRSGGTSWSEGLAIHPSADNGYALTFFRTRTSFTDSTTTWAIGNLGESSTNNFGLLRSGLTGGSGIRVDSIFDVTQAGVFRFGFNPTVGSDAVLKLGKRSLFPDNSGADSSAGADAGAAI